MEPLTMMRRADGKLFTLTIKGQEHLALWPSLQSAMRYKKRNPQLLIFIAASVASPFGRKSLAGLRNAKMGLFLLIDEGGAHFGDGHRIEWAELDASLPSASSGASDSRQAQSRLDDDGGRPIL